jgi:hypothetical protein
MWLSMDFFFFFFFFFLNGAVGFFLFDSAGRVCVTGVAGVAVRAEWMKNLKIIKNCQHCSQIFK